MIDIVYALGNDSRWNNNELRFSLRSIEKHLHDYGKIYIVGEHPKFLQNVFHIPKDDPHSVPDRNIMEKITEACNNPEISDPFLFFNDDHYLLFDYWADKFPYYYDGTLRNMIDNRGTDSYGLRIKNTMELLKEHSKPIKHFDVHTPILYHKKEFIEHVTKANWDKRHGMVIKSLYANSLKIEGEPMTDPKGDKPPSHKARLFSTTPRVTAATFRFLIEKFPKKSIFEQWDVKESPGD